MPTYLRRFIRPFVILAAAILLSVSVLMLVNSYTLKRIGFELYPYFYPQHTCYTIAGVELADAKQCIAEENKLLAVYNWGAPDTLSGVNRTITACRDQCINTESCTRYVVEWPKSMYESNVIHWERSFVCHLVAGH